MRILFLLIFSYLLGSLPTAFLMGKLYWRKDIRKFGSGNVGATNAFRVFGIKAGIFTLMIDIVKGGLVVLAAGLFFDEVWLKVICGGLVILGHDFPVWLKFKGGKGVATTLGVFLALAPITTLLCFSFMVIGDVLTHYISVGSLIFAGSLPVVAWVFGNEKIMLIFSLLAGGLIFFQHRSNIKRLLKGKENKIF